MTLARKVCLSMAAAALLLMMVAAGIAWAAASGKLIINGKVATTDVRIINGQAYVPLSPTAKALNMVVVKKPGGIYEMVVAGGANQVSGSRQGKIGDWLFTGQWRFRVVSIKTADTYTERYYQARKIKPQRPGEELIIVDCQIKNGINKQQSPILTERMPRNTGLADAAGHSYAPIDYDAQQAEDKTQSYEGKPLLPGAMADFALVFSVPKGTKPAALVFTCFRYTPPPASELDDVRVTLQ